LCEWEEIYSCKQHSARKMLSICIDLFLFTLTVLHEQIISSLILKWSEVFNKCSCFGVDWMNWKLWSFGGIRFNLKFVFSISTRIVCHFLPTILQFYGLRVFNNYFSQSPCYIWSHAEFISQHVVFPSFKCVLVPTQLKQNSYCKVGFYHSNSFARLFIYSFREALVSMMWLCESSNARKNCFAPQLIKLYTAQSSVHK